MLGIVGGMGPQAASNLFENILRQSKAGKDQDHLPLLLWSTPDRIVDRSAFLLGNTKVNPAYAVADIIVQMHQIGVQIFGIPCNTFHAKPIWEVLQQRLKSEINQEIHLIHMIKKTVDTIASYYPKANIGVLGTLGTYQSNIYANALNAQEINFVEPKKMDQEKVHQSIYNDKFGIKATAKVTNESLQLIQSVVDNLLNQGVDIILLGCTELSLIPIENIALSVKFIDPVEVLAKAMIEAYKKIEIEKHNHH